MVTSHFAATPQSDVVRICVHEFQHHGDGFGMTENACFRAGYTLRSQFHQHHCSPQTLMEIVSKITPTLDLSFNIINILHKDISFNMTEKEPV